MASAGRILIMPKGNYDSGVTYEMLDLVFNGGASWVAKKSVVGIEPSDTNSEYWMKMCESMDLTEVIQRIAALEAQMLGTISLEDIDLSEYATKGEVATVSSAVDALSGRVNGIDGTVSGLSQTVSGLSQSVANASGKLAVASYTGTGVKPTADIPVSVTFDFAPKVIFMLGWSITDKPFDTVRTMQTCIRNGSYEYSQTTIFCDLLSTDFKEFAGFVNWTEIDQPTRYAKKSADGKTISWYGVQGEYTNYFNVGGWVYYVLGIA